jgi:hypothetical protein
MCVMYAVSAARYAACGCSLPAAAALDSQQVLQLFKAAVRYEGVKEAKFRTQLRVDRDSDSDDDETKSQLELQ